MFACCQQNEIRKNYFTKFICKKYRYRGIIGFGFGTAAGREKSMWFFPANGIYYWIRGCSSVGERTVRIREVEGSTPFISTKNKRQY